MHRAALERIVEVLAVGSRTVEERSAGSAQRAGMADRRARAVVVAGCERAFYIIQAARRETEPHHVDRKIFAFCPHRGRKAFEVDGDDAFGKALGDSDGRERLVSFFPFLFFLHPLAPKTR